VVSAFEGDKAETKTMLPVIEKFMAARQLPDVTVVADAGMIREANQKPIEATGLSFILDMKIPDVPYQVAQWRREHPGQNIPDGHVFPQHWPPGCPPVGVTRSSTTAIRPTGQGGRCAGSTISRLASRGSVRPGRRLDPG
jgi:hypothetical protein